MPALIDRLSAKPHPLQNPASSGWQTNSRLRTLMNLGYAGLPVGDLHDIPAYVAPANGKGEPSDGMTVSNT
jgi:hypothetical protein